MTYIDILNGLLLLVVYINKRPTLDTGGCYAAPVRVFSANASHWDERTVTRITSVSSNRSYAGSAVHKLNTSVRRWLQCTAVCK